MNMTMNFYQRRIMKRQLVKTTAIVACLALIAQQSVHFLPQPAARASGPESIEASQDSNTPAIAAAITTKPTPKANPALGQSCGLDIALVIDTSGSVDSGEMTQ